MRPPDPRPVVGFLRHYYLPYSETFIHDSLRSLQRYQPRVFAISRLNARKFPLDGIADITVLGDRWWGWPEALLYGLTTWSPRFFRWARQVRLIHAHMGWAGVHGLYAARRLGLPLVTSFYGQDATVLGSRTRFLPGYWHFWLGGRRLFARGDRFIVLSEMMRRALAALGCPADKIRIVRLGVDLDRFALVARPARARPTALMVGREVDKKGFDDGLRACALAREQGVDLRVVVLGAGGSLRGSLMRLGESLGLDVAWPDPSTPVPRAMADADILLVPSRTAADGDREGTPTVICEGSASGLPVVSTHHSGIPEQVVHGVTGFLAAERDPEGLAGHLVELARDPDLRAALGRAGREKMLAEYSVAAHRRALEGVYDELLSHHPPVLPTT